MGNVFLPGHSAWATLLLWVAAQIGALIAWQLRLPRVIGMLLAGMFMQVGSRSSRQPGARSQQAWGKARIPCPSTLVSVSPAA